MSTHELPPGFGESSVSIALRMGADPYGLLAEGRRRFGDVFTLRLPGDPPRVIVCAPEDVRRVLTLGHDDYTSDDQSLHLNLGPQSVLFSDGDRHRRRRQLLMPPLHGPRLRSYAHTMQQITDRHIDRLQTGEVVRARDLLRHITLDVILECVFGLRGDEGRGLRLAEVTEHWLDAVLSPGMFMASMALTANRLRHILDSSTRRSLRRGARRRRLLPWHRIGDAKAELMQMLFTDVRLGRTRGVQDRNDVLALLLQARYDDGEPMGDEDVVDQLVTLLVGGHETTANTLAWTLHHVLRDSDACARARAERREVFGSGPVDPTRTGELHWHQACIVEAMRVSPIAPAVSRTLTGPQRFGSWTVPARTIVWAGVFLVHHRDDLWPDPSRYDPSRFIDAATPRPEHFLPFGGGRRRCLGAAFAELEMRIVLSRILERCDLEPTGTDTRARMHGITVVPSDGVPLKVRNVSP